MNRIQIKMLRKSLELVTQALETEEEFFDNRPVSWQDSDNGDLMQDGIAEMKDAKTALTAALQGFGI